MRAAVTIEDPDDPRLADYVDLVDPDLRRRVEAEGGFFIAESPLVVRRLFASGRRVRSVLVTPAQREVLADCLGLTSIHVNRTLKQMRQDGLVRISSGWVEIENLDLLRDAAHDRPRIGSDEDWKIRE